MAVFILFLSLLLAFATHNVVALQRRANSTILDLVNPLIGTANGGENSTHQRSG